FDTLYDRHFTSRENSFHARVAKVYGLIAAHEHRLAERLTDYLKTIPGLKFIGRVPSSDGRLAPVIGFSIAGCSSSEIVRELNKRQIALGNGDFWAARVIKALGMTADEGVIRIGLAHYNNDSDVDRLIAALREIV
ncbi:MAG TPA: aminotransferase class V-fold PLP-dependent enzyme, partial [Dongiaceae bacterium]|nr:aminotransferase class V-fold PLP-dependent enzyme [Dongiaceae bacterium]